MSVRRTKIVDGPIAKALAALATAGENTSHTVRRVDPDEGVVIMTTGLSLDGLSLGYIATGFVESAQKGVRVHVDVTPRIGFWAIEGAADQADEILAEMENVLAAPKARVRRPDQTGTPRRPFGFRPQLLGLAWAATSYPFYTLGIGGPFAIAGYAGLLGGLLLLKPLRHPAWSWTLVVLAILSLPFGVLGSVARRLGRAQALWQDVTG